MTSRVMVSLTAVSVLVLGLCPQVLSQPQNCTGGKTYKCGSLCPLTCDNFSDPPACVESCVYGCFCEIGQVEHNGVCINPSECPTGCPGGKIYKCGSLCPLTCDNFSNPPACVESCRYGCYCETGQVEHNGVCINPSQCPTSGGTSDGTMATPRIDECSVKFCQEHTYCQISSTTGNAVCVPDCSRDNGGCSQEQNCEVETFNCTPHNSEPCDPSLYVRCRDPPYVPCGQDAFLACDSEWTVCLQQNKTRRASCFSSCLDQNGNCGEENVCVTVPNESQGPSLQCLNRNALPSDCPAGQQMNICGDHCQQTCEEIVAGREHVCIEICGPPACVCPRGLVLFRDRCVDPRICYFLETYPPAINPLPLISNRSLYSFISPGTPTSNFHQDSFLGAVRTMLSGGGFPNVRVDLHGVYHDRNLQIVVQLSGKDVNEQSSAQFTVILRENSHQLPVPVSQVSPVDVECVHSGNNGDGGSGGLSRTILIAVICVSCACGLILVLATFALIATCYCHNKTPQHQKLKMSVRNVMSEDDDESVEYGAGKARLEFQSVS